MADEQELNEQEVPGVDEGVEESTAQPTAEEPAARQPKTPPSDDLDNDPRFRKWKSEYDQRISRMEQTYQQQLQQQRQELREKQLSEMDDYQRLQFELEEERQAKAYAYQQLNEVQAKQQKYQVLSEISQAMEVPINELEDAQDYMDAIRLAGNYKRQSEERRAAEAAAAAAAKQRQKQDKQHRNQVDTGLGSNPSPNTWEQHVKGARTSQDLAKLYWQQE